MDYQVFDDKCKGRDYPKLMRYIIVFMGVLLLPPKLYAYPQFIGMGYTSCMTCHYNPYGNGALTDYGRGVAATALSDRLFIPQSVTEEDLSYASGAFFSKPSQSWFRPSFDYRKVYYEQNIKTDQVSYNDFTMQNDVAVVLKFGEKDKFFISTSYTILPKNNFYDGQEEEAYSKEHYIGYRFTEAWGAYIGKMDKVFGIRVPDHYAFSRQNNSIGHSDQVHSAMLHYKGEELEMGLQYFIGDREKDPDQYGTGLSGKLEYDLTKKVRVGFSLLREDKDQLDSYIKALTAKVQVGKGSAILLEVGQNTQTPVAGDENTFQYLFLQGYYHLSRGLYFISTFEQFIADITEENEILRFAPGIQYFPWQRVEIRADLYGTRNYVEETATRDDWRFLGQLHLWF